jgi:hypothetical protein
MDGAKVTLKWERSPQTEGFGPLRAVAPAAIRFLEIPGKNRVKPDLPPNPINN